MTRMTPKLPLLSRRGVLAAAGGFAACAARPARAVEIASARYDREWLASIAPYAARSAAVRDEAARTIARGPFAADWGSLQGWRAPDWYRGARFGVFIHWGVYSVPAFGSEWYSRNMYQPGTDEFAHHIATYGPQDRFGYKDFIPRFTAPAFDPAAWARLFREAGARYVVPVAEHHDGFQMYASQLSDWTAARMGPKRDVVGEIARAVRAEGMRLGVSSHRAEHDWFFDGGRTFPSDVQDPRYALLYGPAQAHRPGRDDQDLMGDFTHVSQTWLDDWRTRTFELGRLYQPDLIYFDWWIGHPSFRNALPQMLAAYYNQRAEAGGEGVVNYKLGEFAPGSGVLDIERGQAPSVQPDVWQTCTSISRKSWGYVEGDSYKSPKELLHLLIDVASKNGNLLLNVGPRADGTIPEAAQATFRAMGGWLKANGEAIYDTLPWRTFGEGPTQSSTGSFSESEAKPYTGRDVRYTTRGQTLYAILLGWPDGGAITLRSVRPQDGFARARLVGGGDVAVAPAPDGLRLTLPAAPQGEFAHVVRLERG